MEQTAGAGVAGDDGEELDRGGRSSGALGFGVREHGRRQGGVLRPPGGALSTYVCSVAALGNGGHGGDMAGGEELSAPTGIDVRGRKRARGEGETTQKLTAGAAVASASSGRHRSEQSIEGDLRRPAVETKTVASFQASRGCVLRLGEAVIDGGPVGHGNGARRGQ